MFLVSSCNCLCPIRWSQVSNRKWRCSWSSADKRCSNYIWVINNVIAYWNASYIRDLMVYKYYVNMLFHSSSSITWTCWEFWKIWNPYIAKCPAVKIDVCNFCVNILAYRALAHLLWIVLSGKDSEIINNYDNAWDNTCYNADDLSIISALPFHTVWGIRQYNTFRLGDTYSISVSKLGWWSIDSGNGLSPSQCQTITSPESILTYCQLDP